MTFVNKRTYKGTNLRKFNLKDLTNPWNIQYVPEKAIKCIINNEIFIFGKLCCTKIRIARKCEIHRLNVMAISICVTVLFIIFTRAEFLYVLSGRR